MLGALLKNQAKIAQLASQHDLALVVLFGSQATGKTHAQSDVDLAFLPQERIRPLEQAKMELAFQQNLGIGNLEMTNLKDASPLLLKQVAQKGKLLYEKEESDFARFKIYAFKRYMEAQPLLKLREISFNKFLQKT